MALWRVTLGTRFIFLVCACLHLVARRSEGLSDYGFAPADLRAIERDNALALFSRLKG